MSYKNRKWVEGEVNKTGEDLYRNYHQPTPMSELSGVSIDNTRGCYMTDLDFVEYGYIDGQPTPLFFKDIIFVKKSNIEEYQKIYEWKYEQHSNAIYRSLARASQCLFLMVMCVYDEEYSEKYPASFVVGNGLRKSKVEMMSVKDYTERLIAVRVKCMNYKRGILNDNS